MNTRGIVIVKFGTETLKTPGAIAAIADDCMLLREQGYFPIIVSSGARARAEAWLSKRKEDDSSPYSAAELAALGSSLLFREWTDAFEVHGVLVAQLLPTHTNFLHDGESASVGERTVRMTYNPHTIVVANWNDFVSHEAMDEVRRGRGENDLHTVLLCECIGQHSPVSHVLFVTGAGGYNCEGVRIPSLRLDDHPELKLGMYEAMDRTRGGTDQNGILPKLYAADKCADRVPNVGIGSRHDIVPFVLRPAKFQGTRILR